jgi:hypothetical protein
LQSPQAQTNVTSPPSFQGAAAFHDIRPTRHARFVAAKVKQKNHHPFAPYQRFRVPDADADNYKDFILEYHNRCQANSIL